MESARFNNVWSAERLLFRPSCEQARTGVSCSRHCSSRTPGANHTSPGLLTTLASRTEHFCSAHRGSPLRHPLKTQEGGVYQHTALELAWGAKIAWRNSTRCTGRLHWRDLTVRDMRHLTRAEDIFESLIEHI